MRISDWSSDVCSSDLYPEIVQQCQHQNSDGDDGRRGRIGAYMADLNNDLVAYARPEHQPPVIHGNQAADPELGDRLRRERSEEHTSELQSLLRISYAVLGLKKKTDNFRSQTFV